MTKRAAMVLAGLVVTALLVGAGAFTGRIGAFPEEASAEPIVRTVERTVTVHRKAKRASGSALRTVVLPQAGPTASFEHGDDHWDDDHWDDDHWDDDRWDDDHWDDDRWDDDHWDDDHWDDDHWDDDHHHGDDDGWGDD